MLVLPCRFMQIMDFRLIIIFTPCPIVHFKMSDILKDTIQMVINFEQEVCVVRRGVRLLKTLLNVYELHYNDDTIILFNCH